MAELLSKDMLADLIINIINILVLFFVTKALLYKPVKKYLAARKQKAAEEAAKLHEAQTQANELCERYEALIKDADAKSAELINEASAKARKTAEAIEADAQRKAQSIIDDANADAKRIHDKAINESRDAVTEIALEISGKLMGRTVTDEDNKKIIDSFFAG